LGAEHVQPEPGIIAARLEEIEADGTEPTVDESLEEFTN
jgi:hypothetical protein